MKTTQEKREEIIDAFNDQDYIDMMISDEAIEEELEYWGFQYMKRINITASQYKKYYLYPELNLSAYVTYSSLTEPVISIYKNEILNPSL